MKVTAVKFNKPPFVPGVGQLPSTLSQGGGYTMETHELGILCSFKGALFLVGASLIECAAVEKEETSNAKAPAKKA